MTINKVSRNGTMTFHISDRADTTTAPMQVGMKLINVDESITEIFEVTGFSDILIIE